MRASCLTQLQNRSQGKIAARSYAYLMSRNSLEFARRAAGVRGIVTGFLGLSRVALRLLRQERRPSATPEDRARAAIRVAGMRRGAVDFIRRR